jgi:hypothetical protein
LEEKGLSKEPFFRKESLSLEKKALPKKSHIVFNKPLFLLKTGFTLPFLKSDPLSLFPA